MYITGAARRVETTKQQNTSASRLLGYRLGLPDGIVSYQKSQFGCIFEGLGKGDGIFLGHLYCVYYDHLYFMDNW
jgi:hypothetical protein